jgi:hypothetical protein
MSLLVTLSGAHRMETIGGTSAGEQGQHRRR